jgi:enoyl-CoA hydratase/carnithine racemase
MWGCYLTGMWIYRPGLTRAKEYALTGKPMSGSEAAEVDLINRAGASATTARRRRPTSPTRAT